MFLQNINIILLCFIIAGNIFNKNFEENYSQYHLDKSITKNKAI